MKERNSLFTWGLHLFNCMFLSEQVESLKIYQKVDKAWGMMEPLSKHLAQIAVDIYHQFKLLSHSHLLTQGKGIPCCKQALRA